MIFTKMGNKKLFYNKIAKGLVSLVTIIILLSSILASSIYYNNNITANAVKEIPLDSETGISITEVDEIKELSFLNEGWYQIRSGYVFYLDTFNSYVPLYIKVLNQEQQNGLLAVDADGDIEFGEVVNLLSEREVVDEEETFEESSSQITGEVTGLEGVSGFAIIRRLTWGEAFSGNVGVQFKIGNKDLKKNDKVYDGSGNSYTVTENWAGSARLLSDKTNQFVDPANKQFYSQQLPKSGKDIIGVGQNIRKYEQDLGQWVTYKLKSNENGELFFQVDDPNSPAKSRLLSLPKKDESTDISVFNARLDAPVQESGLTSATAAPAPAPASPPTAPATTPAPIPIGKKGEDVAPPTPSSRTAEEIQEDLTQFASLLGDAGYPKEELAKIEKNDRDAIKLAQSFIGLKGDDVDGIVGPITRARAANLLDLLQNIYYSEPAPGIDKTDTMGIKDRTVTGTTGTALISPYGTAIIMSKDGQVKIVSATKEQVGSYIDASPTPAPATATNLYAEARKLAEEKKYDDALTKVNEYINKNPKDANGYHLARFINFLKEDYPAALGYAKKYLELKPDDVGAKNLYNFYLALASNDKNELEEAIKVVSDAARTSTSTQVKQEYTYAEATALKKLGREQESNEKFIEAFILNPSPRMSGITKNYLDARVSPEGGIGYEVRRERNQAGDEVVTFSDNSMIINKVGGDIEIYDTSNKLVSLVKGVPKGIPIGDPLSAQPPAPASAPPVPSLGPAVGVKIAVAQLVRPLKPGAPVAGVAAASTVLPSKPDEPRLLEGRPVDLGEGKYGFVGVYKDTKTGLNYVSVDDIKPNFEKDGKTISNFEVTAKGTPKLLHPSQLQGVNTGQWDGNPAAMPLSGGGWRSARCDANSCTAEDKFTTLDKNKLETTIKETKTEIFMAGERKGETRTTATSNPNDPNKAQKTETTTLADGKSKVEVKFKQGSNNRDDATVTVTAGEKTAQFSGAVLGALEFHNPSLDNNEARRNLVLIDAARLGADIKQISRGIIGDSKGVHLRLGDETFLHFKGEKVTGYTDVKKGETAKIEGNAELTGTGNINLKKGAIVSITDKTGKIQRIIESTSEGLEAVESIYEPDGSLTIKIGRYNPSKREVDATIPALSQTFKGVREINDPSSPLYRHLEVSKDRVYIERGFLSDSVKVAATVTRDGKTETTFLSLDSLPKECLESGTCQRDVTTFISFPGGGAKVPTTGKKETISIDSDTLEEGKIANANKVALTRAQARREEREGKPSPAQEASQRFFANVERIFTEFQGLGYYATLFFEEDDLLKWRENVDRVFATAYLGTEYWSSAICGEYLDGEDEGIAYAETPQGLAQVAAHIEATRTEPIQTDKGQEFIYKITFNVRNGDYDKDPRAPEEMHVNVILRGEKTATVFKQEQRVKRGSSFGRIGRNAIVQDSTAFFNEICLTFDNVPFRWKVSNNEICNTIVESSGAPSTVSTATATTTTTSGSGAAEGDVNDF